MGKRQGDELSANQCYSSRKVALRGHSFRLGGATGDALDNDIVDILSRISLWVSMRRYIASKIANYIITLSVFSQEFGEIIQDMIYNPNNSPKMNPTKSMFWYNLLNLTPQRGDRHALFRFVPDEILNYCAIEELFMDGQGPLLGYTADDMAVSFTNHLGNFDLFQKYAVDTQLRELYPNMGKKRLSKIIKVVIKMINNINTTNIPDECHTQEVKDVIDLHRDLLGLGPYEDGPDGKIMTKDVVAKDPQLAIDYFSCCLAIQEGVENTRRFNLSPQFKPQHGFARIGHAMFYYILMECGGLSKEEKEALKKRLRRLNGTGNLAGKFNRLPDAEKRKYWGKLFDFEKYECDNDDQKREFIYEILTDGVSIVFKYKVTKKNDQHNHPRAKILPEPRVPSSVTTECEEVVGFGIHPTLTRRDVVENHEDYVKRCIYIVHGKGDGCCPKMRELVDYATGKLHPPPPNTPSLQSIIRTPKHDSSDSTQLDGWWPELSEDEAKQIIFFSHQDNPYSTASLKCKYFWSCDPGHTNLISMQLFYMDKNGNIHAVGKRIDVKKSDYYQKACHKKHTRKMGIWLEPFKDTFQDMSQHSTKTTDLDQLVSNANAFATIRVDYWNEVSKRRHRRIRFHCFVMKEKFLTRMFQEIRHRSYLEDGEVPLVIMGDASVPVSIRGTITAPVKYIQELFKRFCEMIYASEFRTSIICWRCGCLTSKCALYGVDGYPDICRGLLYCGGITCRLNQQQLTHRDDNGLKCILISLLFRPAILQRGGANRSLSKMRKIHYINPSLTRRKEELELQAELVGEMIQAFPFDVDMEDADDVASADESSNLSGSEMDSSSEVDGDAEEKSVGDDEPDDVEEKSVDMEDVNDDLDEAPTELRREPPSEMDSALEMIQAFPFDDDDVGETSDADMGDTDESLEVEESSDVDMDETEEETEIVDDEEQQVASYVAGDALSFRNERNVPDWQHDDANVLLEIVFDNDPEDNLSFVAVPVWNDEDTDTLLEHIMEL